MILQPQLQVDVPHTCLVIIEVLIKVSLVM